jgi:hypothetical protein
LSYYGYSTPCFFRGKNDSLFLAVGSEWGELFLFTGIEGNLDGKFRPLGPLKGVHEGWRTGCTVSRFDNDTLPDLLVGNFAGGLGYFTGSFPSELGISDLEKVQQMSLRVFPNPASERAEVGIAGLSPNLKAVLKIYALNGVQIWASQPFAGKISVCLSGFPRGVFLIKAEVTGTCGYPPEPLYGKLVKIR